MQQYATESATDSKIIILDHSDEHPVGLSAGSKSATIPNLGFLTEEFCFRVQTQKKRFLKTKVALNNQFY